MERDSIKCDVVDVLNLIQQRLSGKVDEIGDSDCVIGTVARFDSLCGLEATVKLEARLHFTLPENVFVNEQGTRALTLNEVVDRVFAASKTGA